MKASIKQAYLSCGIFAVLLLATALVFRGVPSTELFYLLGVVGVLFSFMTVALARIPNEDFAPGTGAFRVFRRVVKLLFTVLFGSTAVFCLGVFVLVLWIRFSRHE
jgi:hypothetical protein